MKSIGIVVPTYQGAHHIERCLQSLLGAKIPSKVLVIDSSSSDGTPEIARKLGAAVIVIPKKEFNHGATREIGRRLLNTEIAVMVTQDSYPCEGSLEKLVEPLLNGEAEVSYGRQLARDDATFFERFHRAFNYPSNSYVGSLSQEALPDARLFFCSNSFAAYLNSALDCIGGFERIVFGEDTVAVARMLRKGCRIAYVAEACAVHSHEYTLRQEFRRHLDIGYVREAYRDLLACSSDSSRGQEYAKRLLYQLSREAPCQLPYACALLLTKWIGYQIGRRSKKNSMEQPSQR